MKSNSDGVSDVARVLNIEESSEHGKKPWKWIFVALIAGVTAVVVIWNMTGASKEVRYETREARTGDLTLIVTATGALQPTVQVDVSSELSGIIKTVAVDHNDHVKVGQALATLDSMKVEAQVMQSKAVLESAEASVLQAQATVKEMRSKLGQLRKAWALSGNKVPSQSEMDAAEAALERARADEVSAKAAVSQARATLEAHETDLSKSVIVSPINGVVLARSAEPGQTVAASFQAPVLFTLAEDLTQMELHVDVDEADVGQVREGQTATFGIDAYPGRIFEARITQVRYGSKTAEGVVTYETVLKVDNHDLSLRPGMTATADITVKKVENVVLVPNAALRFTPPVQQAEKSFDGLVGALLPRPPASPSRSMQEATSGKPEQRVWTLKEGKPSAVPVGIGATAGVMTEITAGDIQAGTPVIIDTVGTGL